MQADTKGDIYDGLLEKSAKESPKGAGQYFTPSQLIQAIGRNPAKVAGSFPDDREEKGDAAQKGNNELRPELRPLLYFALN